MPDIPEKEWMEYDDRNTESQPNGWPGGMPAYIDQSGRMMMGAIKRFWRRSNPYYLTTGTGDNYVVEPEVSFPRFNDYEVLRLRIDRANVTASPTLTFGEWPTAVIQKVSSGAVIGLSPGDLVAGADQEFWYDGTQFILSNPGTLDPGIDADLMHRSANLSDVANVVLARQNLGVEIGVNVQAFNAALASIAGLPGAANLMIYMTGANLYATTALTPFARTLLDDTTAGAMLTTLGISAFAQTLLDDADATAFKTTLALQNVNNTSDANKPVSSAQQTALNLKADLASPTFTGDPKAPTPSPGDNDTSIATTAFVAAAIAATAGNNVVAWVNFNGTGVIAIRASKNVSSITDGGVGIYTVNFASALADANYAGVATAGTGAAGLVATGPSAVPTTTTFRITVVNVAGAVTDADYVSFAAMR
ncbi:hypothetical protein LZK73_18315 [Neorhizobium galegae]|nr:hypothetical protein LZK73_18315 [Neorhizobium galegae]